MLVRRLSVMTLPRARPPRVNLRFRVFRDGAPSAGVKEIRVYRDWDSIEQLCLSFQAVGEYTQVASVDMSVLLAQGYWLVAGLDPAEPRRTRATYLSLGDREEYFFNITNDEQGNTGSGAQLMAQVMVDGQLVDREVVVVERPSDGEWRVAGYGRVGGGSDIDLRVVDGATCYALSVDDYGVEFSEALPVVVGQRIRPTQFAGWLYQVTEAGTLPASEPVWWPAEGDNAPRQLGTARAVAVRYYQPLAHGPVPVEVL